MKPEHGATQGRTCCSERVEATRTSVGSLLGGDTQHRHVSAKLWQEPHTGSQQSSPSLCSPQEQHEAEPGIWRGGQADGEAPRSRCATTRSPAAMTPARIAMLVEASLEVPRTEEVSGIGAELAGGADSSEATVRLVASSADLAAAMLASHGRIPLSIAQTKRWEPTPWV